MNPFSQKAGAVTIAGPCGALEARCTPGVEAGPLAERRWVALVCHPHPLHGGTMNNKVVTTLERCYRDLGVTVVCFNFRGVGASAGEFDHARGEVDDLLAVAAWVRAQQPEAPLLLAGFSFGSSVAAQASYRLAGVRHLVLVAPPVERYPYDQQGAFPCPLVVVQGDQDERFDSAGVYRWRETLQGQVALIRFEAAGHFFHGFLTPLKTQLGECLLQQLQPSETDNG